MARLSRDFPFLTKAQIHQAVWVIFEDLGAALERGERVELRKFGAFSVRHRKARLGRNPRNGNAVEVDAKSVPFFKASKHLVERMSANMETADEPIAEKAVPSR
jgi:integration host factor subunit beta